MGQARRFTLISVAALFLAAGCGERSAPSRPEETTAAAPAVESRTEPPAPAIPEQPRVPQEEPPAAKVTGPVREPVAAGGFYPGDAETLRAKVEGYLVAAKKVALPGRIIAIIAPHAGYAYSGPAAGWAYKQIEGADVDSVVLVGGHSGALPYAAVYASGAYRTPLGDCAVDAGLGGALVRSGDALRDDRRPHEARDHALEVQVPFLQVVLPRARIVPVYFNRANVDIAARVGEGIARSMKGRKALLVCSTDLSHYPDAATAAKTDGAILRAICTLDSKTILETDRRLLAAHSGKNLDCTACGLGAVLATVEAAKKLGATGARVIRYDHSGNYVRKDTSRVVGYGAVAIYGPPTEPAVRDGETVIMSRKVSPPAPPRLGRMLSDEERKMLLGLARTSVQLAFEKKNVPPLRGLSPALRTKTGAFVTLTKQGRLRGCIGTFGRKQELWRVVAQYARTAAFRDTRFRPLAKDELAEVGFEISVLSPLRKLTNPLSIRLGIDGIWVVAAGGRTGTYLPQVGKRFRTKEEFLSDCTKNKAGLPADAWRDPNRATVYAYTAEVFAEKEGKH